MASLRHEAILDAAPEVVWDAVRDTGALQTRLVPGFVVDTRLEPGARTVTFANGLVAKELILGLDEARRRLAWAVTGTTLAYHHASVEVLPHEGGRTRLLWLCDVLPDEAAPRIAAMIEAGLDAMRRHFASG